MLSRDETNTNFMSEDKTLPRPVTNICIQKMIGEQSQNKIHVHSIKHLFKLPTVQF